jgi:hypothetical protein
MQKKTTNKPFKNKRHAAYFLGQLNGGICMPERLSDHTDREVQASRKRQQRVLIAGGMVLAAVAGAASYALLAPDPNASPELPKHLTPPTVPVPTSKGYVEDMHIRPGDKIKICATTFVGPRVGLTILRPVVDSKNNPYYLEGDDGKGTLTLRGIEVGKDAYWLNNDGKQVKHPSCDTETYEGVAMSENSGPFPTTEKSTLSAALTMINPADICKLGGIGHFSVWKTPQEAIELAAACQ